MGFLKGNKEGNNKADGRDRWGQNENSEGTQSTSGEDSTHLGVLSSKKRKVTLFSSAIAHHMDRKC